MQDWDPSPLPLLPSTGPQCSAAGRAPPTTALLHTSQTPHRVLAGESRQGSRDWCKDNAGALGEGRQGVGQGVRRASSFLLPSGLRPRSFRDPEDPRGTSCPCSPSSQKVEEVRGPWDRWGGVAGKPLKANQGLGKGSVATAARGSPPHSGFPSGKRRPEREAAASFLLRPPWPIPGSPHLARPAAPLRSLGPNTMLPALRETAARAAPERGPGVTFSPQHPSPLKDDENSKPQPSGSAQSTAPTPADGLGWNPSSCLPSTGLALTGTAAPKPYLGEREDPREGTLSTLAPVGN